MCLPDFVNFVLKTLEDNGFRAFAVGGCVRDLRMGRTPNDWDIATSASPSQVERIFKRTAPTGVRYGTVTVFVRRYKAEVTTFRRDGEYNDGRKPERVDFVDDITDDLKRRDFTINAMAMGLDGKIIDPFGGAYDLRRKVIRCVGSPAARLSEDALRMLRAVRFSAQLGFDIDEDTLNAIRENASDADKLSAERVSDEIRKILLSPKPEYVGLLAEYGLLGRFEPERHPVSDFFVLRDMPPEFAPRMALAGLLLRPSDAGGILRQLRVPGKICKLADEAEQCLADGGTARELLVSHSEESVILASKMLGGDAAAKAREEIERRQYVRVGELAINGGDLMKIGYSGAEIGEILLDLALRVTRGEIANKRSELLRALG